jgi:hypothetical protein
MRVKQESSVTMHLCLGTIQYCSKIFICKWINRWIIKTCLFRQSCMLLALDKACRLLNYSKQFFFSMFCFIIWSQIYMAIPLLCCCMMALYFTQNLKPSRTSSKSSGMMFLPAHLIGLITGLRRRMDLWACCLYVYVYSLESKIQNLSAPNSSMDLFSFRLCRKIQSILILRTRYQKMHSGLTQHQRMC